MGGAPAPTTGAERKVALLAIGSTVIALPSDIVREAAPWPTRVTPAAGAAAPVLGYFRLRAQALPLYDLRAGLGLAAPTRTEAGRRMVAIVDIARDGRIGRVGLAVDAAQAVAPLSEDRLTTLAQGADGAPALGLVSGEDADAVTLHLDAAALARLPNMLVAEIAAAAPRARAAAARALLFEWRGLTLAAPVEPLREIISAPPLAPLRPRSDALLGATLVRGERLAMLDLDCALGLAEPAAAAPPPLAAVFESGGVRFAAPAARIVTLCDLTAAERAPFPPGAAGMESVAEALIAPDGRPALLLDIERLGRRADLRALAPTLAAPRRDAESGFGAPVRLAKMLAGGALYADLLDLLELTEAPREALMLTERSDDLAGFAWRRGAVAPVMDLRRHLGARAPTKGAALRLAMVAGPTRPVGLIIDGVDGVERLRLDLARRPPEHEGAWSGVSALARESCRLVAARDGARPKTIRLLDVKALAARIEADASAAAHPRL